MRVRARKTSGGEDEGGRRQVEVVKVGKVEEGWEDEGGGKQVEAVEKVRKVAEAEEDGKARKVEYTVGKVKVG